MKPEVIVPGLPVHELIKRAVEESEKKRAVNIRRTRGMNYNDVAIEYNKAPVDSYIDIGNQRSHIGNLIKVFNGRGLKNGRDYDLHRITTDSEGHELPRKQRTVAVHKLTDTEMRTI